MPLPPLATLGVLAGLALGCTACNRSDKVPAPPKVALAPAAAPAVSSDPGTASDTAPRGMGGVAGASAGPVAGGDRVFVSEAANRGMAEVEAAQLAAGRTGNASIKGFAQQMERDHTSVNDELKRIADQKGIDLPSTIAGEPRGQLSRLSTLSQADMDQAFLQDFGIDAHQKAIALFEREAREGQDPDFKAFAERTLAKLREHLAMAQQMQTGRVGSTAGPH
ncbi:MAG: hypothetical protein H6R10_1539 [Rhodocyclaceae bacterium]|nr:hypothetical protein [Rhodocyclaceae bacterium]